MTKQRALSLEGKLNQNGIKERIKSTFIKKERTGPWVIELDPTTACNLACHDCISANLLNQGGIDPKRLLKLADVQRNFDQVRVSDRSLVWNTDLVETIERQVVIELDVDNGADDLGDPSDLFVSHIPNPRLDPVRALPRPR